MIQIFNIIKALCRLGSLLSVLLQLYNKFKNSLKERKRRRDGRGRR